MPPAFAITWDYRCPFARNLNEHVVAGLDAGAPWDVTFLAFSLNQVHVEDGQPDVWDDPESQPSLLAMQVGIAVRDRWPAAFNATHVALFAARHDDALDIREEEVIRSVLSGQGLDADAVMAEVRGGGPLDTFRKEHERGVADHNVFGVPTIIAGEQSVFIRVMHRPHGDGAEAQRTVDRLLDLVTGWPDLNEFKHTRIPR